MAVLQRFLLYEILRCKRSFELRFDFFEGVIVLYISQDYTNVIELHAYHVTFIYTKLEFLNIALYCIFIAGKSQFWRESGPSF